MKVVAVTGVLLSLAVLAGCGGPDAKAPGVESVKVAPAPSASAGSGDLPSGGTLRTYFDGVATATLSSYHEAMAAAEPGSPAAAYVTYLRAAAQAVVDGGAKVAGPHVSAEVKDGGFEFCNGAGSGKTCYRYADITGARGKVVDFSVNGKPIGNRVVVGSGGTFQPKGSDASGSFVAAFESTAGNNLFVVVRVAAGTHPLSGVRATYGPSHGSQSSSTRMSGPATLEPGSEANYAFAFSGAHIGDVLTLTLHDAAGADRTVAVEIS